MGRYSSDEDRKRKKRKKRKSRSRSRSYESVDSRYAMKHKKAKKAKHKRRSRSLSSTRSSRKSSRIKSRSRSRGRSRSYGRRSPSKNRDRRPRRSRSRSYKRRSRSRSYGKRSRSKSYGRRSRSRSYGRRSRSGSRNARRSRTRSRSYGRRSRSRDRHSKKSKRYSRSRSRDRSSRAGAKSPNNSKKDHLNDDPCACIPGFTEMTASEQTRVRMNLALKAAAAADEKLKEGLTGEKSDSPISFKDQEKYASAIAEIESNEFVPSTFKSSRYEKKYEDKKSMDDFAFGTVAEIKIDPTKKFTIPTDITVLAHENLSTDPEVKMDRWIEKLKSMRRKKLEGEAIV
ncbi:hypothetical protein ScPMuIL_017417 [Solemya velum]